MRFVLRGCLVALVAASSGCPGAKPEARPRPAAPDAVGNVDRVEVHTTPTAVNWDDKPGPDGVGVQVYCFQLDQPMPVVVSGTLEFLLYEGNVGGAALADAKPFYTWSYTGPELKGFMAKNVVGWHYSLRLLWGVRSPQGEYVTIITRYLPPMGQAIYSRPTAIPLGQ